MKINQSKFFDKNGRHLRPKGDKHKETNTMQTKSQCISWTKTAENTADDHIKSAKFYISEGIDPGKALDLSLKNSTLGEKYKQQVRNAIINNNQLLLFMIYFLFWPL